MTDKRNRDTLSYSFETLKAVIRANPDSTSIESLSRFFPETDISLLIADLHKMQLEGSAKITHGKFFAATKPLSDLAIARVTDIHDRERTILKLEGIKDIPLEVSLAAKQVRQHRLKKGDRILVKISRHHGTELKAKCINKLSYTKNPILTGHFTKAANGELRFVPNDKTIHTTFSAVGAVPKDAVSDQIFVGTIPGRIDLEDPVIDIAEQRWDPQTGNKIAHIIANRHNLLIRHSDEAQQTARKIQHVPRDNNDHRRMFNEKILVVDPANSPGDFDDGIFAEFTPNGLLRTLVVVTDVASYIMPHSRLDKHALERGRSYYFPQEREFFHMFPEKLSIDRMALREGSLHPVLYMEQFWDPSTGELVDMDHGMGMVRNHRNLTYQAFQNMLNANTPDMKPYLKFDEFAWTTDREKTIQLSEGAYEFTIQQGKDIVQAMMARANTGFAAVLEERDAMYLRRNHAGHFNDMAYDLAADQLRIWGFDAPYEAHGLTPLAINNILMEADALGMKEKVEGYVRENLLYRAEYSIRSIGHWGTGNSVYGHFTSPIRRYADLFNQRSYHSTFGIRAFGLTDEMNDVSFAQHVAAHLNGVDHKALMVERDSVRYYAIRDLQRYEGDKLIAVLHNVTPTNGVEILLPKLGLRKVIEARDLPPDWRVAPNQHGLTFQNKVFMPVNSTLRVKIGSVAPHRARWDITEIEPRSVPRPKSALGRRGTPRAVEDGPGLRDVG